MVAEHERRHGFYNGHRAREDTRIVAATGLECSGSLFCRDAALALENGGSRFERGAKENRHPVGNAALNTARMVACGDNMPIVGGERIIMFRTAHGWCQQSLNLVQNPYRH